MGASAADRDQTERLRIDVSGDLEESLAILLDIKPLTALQVKTSYVELVLDHTQGQAKQPKASQAASVKRLDCDVNARALIRNMPSGRHFLVRGLIILRDGERLSSVWAHGRTQPMTNAAGEDSRDSLGAWRGQCQKCSCKCFRRFQSGAPVEKSSWCRGCGCEYTEHLLEADKDPNRVMQPERREQSMSLPRAALSWDDRQRDMYELSSCRFNPDDMAAKFQRKGLPAPTNMEELQSCRVSVVCPTTDTRHNFHHQLCSVFKAQTWPDKELVVVETYTTEPSAVLKEFAEKDEQIIHVAFKVEPGKDWSIGLKRNMCTHLASGTFIANFDDDDLYAPAYLETMMRSLLEQKSVAVTLNSWYIFDVSCRKFGFVDARNLGFLTNESAKVYGYGFSYMFLRELSLQYPYPNENLGEDAPFFDKIRSLPGPTRLGGWRHVALHDDMYGLCCHTLHPDSTSSVRAQYCVADEEIVDMDVADLACWKDYIGRFDQTREESRYIAKARKLRQVRVWSSQGELSAQCSPLSFMRKVREQVAKQSNSLIDGVWLYRQGSASRTKTWAPEGLQARDEERVGAATTELWVTLPVDRNDPLEMKVNVVDMQDPRISVNVEAYRAMGIKAFCKALFDQHSQSDTDEDSITVSHRSFGDRDWVPCHSSEWIGDRRRLSSPMLAELLGLERHANKYGPDTGSGDEDEDEPSPAGIWMYNQGKSAYEISFCSGEGILWYTQRMAGGKILNGALDLYQGDGDWQWNVTLNNQAEILLLQDGNTMMSQYRKPGATTWCSKVSAQRLKR